MRDVEMMLHHDFGRRRWRCADAGGDGGARVVARHGRRRRGRDGGRSGARERGLIHLGRRSGAAAPPVAAEGSAATPSIRTGAGRTGAVGRAKAIVSGVSPASGKMASRSIPVIGKGAGLAGGVPAEALADAWRGAGSTRSGAAAAPLKSARSAVEAGVEGAPLASSIGATIGLAGASRVATGDGAGGVEASGRLAATSGAVVPSATRITVSRSAIMLGAIGRSAG